MGEGIGSGSNAEPREGSTLEEFCQTAGVRGQGGLSDMVFSVMLQQCCKQWGALGPHLCAGVRMA